MSHLTGKRALVTGASQGIGRAIVEHLAKEGCAVAIHYHSDSTGAETTAADINASGGKAKIFQADLTSQSAATQLVEDAATFLGGLDILINNAGGLIARHPLESITDEFWKKVVDVNMTSTLWVTQQALPWLKKAKGASIVNLASLAGRKGGHSGSLAYSTIKGAVLTWTRSLASELAPHGIRVNALAPGLILGTRFHDTFTTQESANETIRQIPLGRAGTSDDVARAAVFFAAEYDGFITGATLDINGGVYYA